MTTSSVLARRIFLLAGVYGLIAMLPQYGMEARIGRDYPPPITHPEHFYGFIGVTVAWQLVFLAISRAPERLRPIMLIAIVEKLAFGLPAIALYSQDRIPAAVLGFGLFDLVLGALFALAYRATPEPHTQG